MTEYGSQIAGTKPNQSNIEDAYEAKYLLDS